MFRAVGAPDVHVSKIEEESVGHSQFPRMQGVSSGYPAIGAIFGPGSDLWVLS
jgi:hypothetical protein